MSAHNDSKYSVNSKISDLQARVLSLETANKNLLAFVESELQTRINDARNILRGQIRDGIDGAPGKDGRDGVDGQSIVGPQGPRGDVLIPNESEAQAALKEARLNNARRHAAQIARIVDRIEFERTHNLRSFDAHSFGHFRRLLADIQEQIEKLS
jgi:hypothetical protein